MHHAYGKVILLGEHAVVYGVPALALALSLSDGATATVLPSQVATVTINGELCAEPELGRALSAITSFFRAPKVALSVESSLKGGFGLGASAAMGVAAARAIAELVGDPAENDTLLEAVTRWERVFHGSPSGIDAAAACFGGCFLYERDVGLKPVTLGADIPLAVGLVGPPSSTKAMVDSVARFKERRATLFEKALAGIRSLVKNAELCLVAGDLDGLGKLMDYNQMLLASLFVSTSEIESACQAARDAGALGAKLTGAGGGGAVVAVAHDPDAVLTRWKQDGIEGFSCVVPREQA